MFFFCVWAEVMCTNLQWFQTFGNSWVFLCKQSGTFINKEMVFIFALAQCIGPVVWYIHWIDKWTILLFVSISIFTEIVWRLYEAEKQTTLKVILTFILSVCKAMYLYYWNNTTTAGSITPLPLITVLYCTIKQRHFLVNHIFCPPKSAWRETQNHNLILLQD